MSHQVPMMNSKHVSLAKADSSSISGPVGGMIKRLFDFTIAICSLIVLTPIFLFVSVLVKLEDGGSIFYRHSRIGRANKQFDCLKFRTMVRDGDRVLREYLAQNPDAQAEWLATRKLRNDPRVTATGRVLRKTSLDELPQLINIICGDMSIVGPRPVVRDEIPMYGPDFQFYQCARPGLTGAWQISGRNDTSYTDRVILDRQYVEQWSLATDIIIIAKTIPAVAFARGSY